MEIQPLAGSLSIALSGVLLSIYAIYRWLLPNPILGIPYNPKATQSLLGDIPDLVTEVSKSRDLTAWLCKQVTTLNSPVVQVFIRPLGRPFVILSDFRETHDIMTKRKEFDRSHVTADLLSGLLPNHHFILPTDERWKAHRRLLQDLMTPTFLSSVATPAIYDVAHDLVQLWELKTSLAPGQVFSAASDIYFTSLDAVLAFSFGKTFPNRAVRPQTKYLGGFGPESFSAPHENQFMGYADPETRQKRPIEGNGCTEKELPVCFPEEQLHENLQATLGCAAILDSLREAPIPKLTYWWLSRRKSWKKTMATKNGYIADEIKAAERRMHDNEDGQDALGEAWVKSAVDHVVAREAKLAAKEGRTPNFVTPLIMDEVYGFAMAGHETTSTTIVWGLKFLTFYPDIQADLRRDLKAVHTAALSEERLPSADEIVCVEQKGGIPYLDAFIEEVLRCGTIPAVGRDATCDTILLGHAIPKGTTVLMLPNGPSFIAPAFDIDDSRRSSTARKPYSRQPHTNLEKFDPGRWLAPASLDGDDKKVTFDPTAGPQMAFGWGARGCFGKRLAYLELKIIFTLLLWKFEFGQIPAHLSNWEAIDAGISHKPKQCFVRARRTRY